MKLFRRQTKETSTESLPDALDICTSCSSYSLGTGEYFIDGKTNFTRSPSRKSAQIEEGLPFQSRPLGKPIVFKRSSSSFLRVSDLNLTESNGTIDSSDSSTAESIPNFHHASFHPPPGIELDPSEKWIVLDDGEGQHAPIAPFAVEALCQSAQALTLQYQHLWTPDGKTAKLLGWDACTWSTCFDDSCWQMLPPPGSPEEDQVLIWSGTLPHAGYGSDLPLIRAAGIIPMNAEVLMDLLVDSNRVHEYNKLSLGRTDVLVLQDSASKGAFGGITKILMSETRPPLLRKTLRFTSLFHARETSFGYVLVTRAVEGNHNESLGASVLKSEILLGVNVIWKLPGDRCLMTAVNHVRSPMVPMMIAKRIGLQAAVNFIQDLRAAGRSIR